MKRVIIFFAIVVFFIYLINYNNRLFRPVSKKNIEEQFSSDIIHYFKGRRIIWKNIKLNGGNPASSIWTNQKLTLSGTCSIQSSNYQSFNDNNLLIVIGLNNHYSAKVFEGKTKAYTINTSKCNRNTDCTNLGIDNNFISNENGKWECDNNICKINCSTDSDCMEGGLDSGKCVNNKCVISCNDDSDCNNNVIGGYYCKNTNEGKYCSVESSGVVQKDGDILSDNPYYIFNGTVNGAYPYNNISECNRLASLYPISSLERGDFSQQLAVPGGNWINSARNIKTRIVDGNKTAVDAELMDENGNWISSSVEYTPGLSFSNVNGSFSQDFDIKTKRVCQKRDWFFSLFEGPRCKNEVTKKPIIVKQENPQDIWNKNKCNLEENKTYNFNFSVEFLPGNTDFGVVPLYVGYALNEGERNIIKKKNNYVKITSTLYNNNNLDKGGNIGLLTNLNILPKYSYVFKSYTDCSTSCGGGKKYAILDCRNNQTNTISQNESDCAGLTFKNRELDCNTQKCYPQPNIKNIYCYISISRPDGNNNYNNSKNKRLGIRDFRNFNLKDNLKNNPYYNYTRVFTGNSGELDIIWVIFVLEAKDKNNITKAYIYNPEFKLFIMYDEKMNISVVPVELLNENCLWKITADPINSPVYNIQHIKTGKYLYSTEKSGPDYVDKEIKNSSVEGIDYFDFGEINCHKEIQNKWFIVPSKPEEISNNSYQNIYNKCGSKDSHISSQKEFSQIAQLGGINDNKQYWSSNTFPERNQGRTWHNQCLTNCKEDCWLKCLPLVWFPEAYITCGLLCDEVSCPNRCAYLKQENIINKDKPWYKSYTMKKNTDGEITSPGASWIQGFQGGYDSIGNHNRQYNNGICIQNEKSMSKVLGRWTLIDTEKTWYTLNKTKNIGKWAITNINNSRTMTINFWINISKLYSNWTSILHVTNNNSNCCSKGDRVPGVWIYPNSTKILVVADNESSANQSINSGNKEIGIDKNTFVSIVFDQYKIYLYFNGELVTQKNFNNYFINPNANATFYCPDPWYGANSSNNIETRIMDLTFINKVLTQDEIKNMYYTQKLYMEKYN